MAKLQRYSDQMWAFYCPGCKCDHAIRVEGKPPVWAWNGDVDRPTIAPSIHVNRSDPKSSCHSFVTDGEIRFLGDCFHDLANKVVPLPDVEE